jgi:hypothetical protein
VPCGPNVDFEWDVVLTNLGEKMTDEEVDELLKAVDTSSGEINYTGMFATPSVVPVMGRVIDLG